MIEAKELRIGNKILYKGNVITVESICEHGINLDVVGSRGDDGLSFSNEYIPFESLDGVTLSEERLLKLGFEKKENTYHDNDWEKYIYDIESFGGFYLKGSQVIPKPYYFSDAFSESLIIQHVHQLQNIYFALTGEELPYNL